MKPSKATEFVRRQHLEAKDFEFFYYNDINMANVDFHYHPHYEFYFFVSGQVDYIVGDNSFTLKSGDLMIIPPNTIHGIHSVSKQKEYSRFVLWLEVDFIERLKAVYNDIDYAVEYFKKENIYKYSLEPLCFNEIFIILIDLWREYTAGANFSRSISANRISFLMLVLNRLIMERTNKNNTADLYTRVFDYVNSHITEDLTLESIASSFYVSKYHISHIFKEKLGISLYQYIIKKRLSASRGAIAKGEHITAVAESMGFADYTSFYRAFKKEYGISPKEYQKQIRIKQEEFK